MKSRMNLKITALVLLSVIAFTANAQSESNVWSSFKVQVQTHIDAWLAYWRGDAKKEEAAPLNAPAKTVVAKPSAPTGPAAKTIQAPTNTPAPVAVAKPSAVSSSLKDIQNLRDQMKQKSLLRVAQPARAGTSKLTKGREGVPLSDWKTIRVGKRIPRLDIGREALISKEDFTMGHISFETSQPSELKALDRPADLSLEVKKVMGQPAAQVYGVRSLQANLRPAGAPLSQEDINKVKYTLAKTSEIKELPYRPLSEDKMKMLAALILYGKGDSCHIIMGLFYQLSSQEALRTESNFHLGSCARSLKMNQVAFDRLSQVILADDKDYGPLALELLVKDLPIIYEKNFYHLLKNVKSFKNLVTPNIQDVVSYRMAKGAYRAGDYKTSLDYANRINSGTEYSDEARFLVAMNHFALGDKVNALNKLQELSASLESRKVQDKNIRALTAVNLARMYFAQKKYDKAYEHYMQVPKDHPLWVQALTEQGWTQIALEDYSGAIGNMYSLHSPYFKAVYQPETFVVSTIGYLNICQYGDAYKTLTWMEKDYRDFFDRTKGYLENKSQPSTIYQTVRNYIRGKSDQNIDGVPYQVWREMAHRKDFLNVQVALNDKQDESTRYNGINEKIKAEKIGIRGKSEQSKKHFDEWKNKLAQISKDKSLSKFEHDWQQNLRRERDLTIAYRFKLMILEQSRQGFLDFQSVAQKKLDTETAGLTERAGQFLLTHAKDMRDEMSKLLENNEFLRYEVFSGSGENIRYQVAGGKVGAPNRIPASIKPAKMMNWNFDGEFWEDEIGSYRSSLQNACPTSMTKQAQHLDEEEN